MKKALSHLKYMAALYGSHVPALLYRLTLGALISPLRTRKVLEWQTEFHLGHSRDRVLGSGTIQEIAGRGKDGNIDVLIQGDWYSSLSGGTARLPELAGLAYLLQTTQPKRIFEIGTFVGRMTRHLALNAPPDAEIFTLDLPQGDVSHPIGRCFQGRPEKDRIRQLAGSSLEFDFSPWTDSIDFCWIDGGHEYVHVVSDTRAAFQMVKEGGWIGWHDYYPTGWWYPVTRAIRETNARIGGGLRHLQGSAVALTRVTAEAKRFFLRPAKKQERPHEARV